MWVDDDWLNYSGYGRNSPKFRIYCPEHWKKIYGPYFDGSAYLESILQRNMSMAAPAKIESTKTIEWTNVDNLINDGQCKVSILAKELGMSQEDLKTALVEHYAEKIEFRRGRNGGVFWTKE
jgi:hypothetical protein